MTSPVAIVADLHLANFQAHGGNALPSGLNTRGVLCRASLCWALGKAQDLKCQRFFVAGDFFDSRRPEPALIVAAQSSLNLYEDDMGITVLPGNHDIVDRTAKYGNTACHVLRSQATVPGNEFWQTLNGVSTLVVPFESTIPMWEHLRNLFEGSHAGWPEGPRILVTHIGVVDSTSPPWLRDKPDAVDADTLLGWLEGSGFAGAFVGNYHNHRMWKQEAFICQVGTLCPSSHSDDGVFPQVGGMATWAPGDSVPTMYEIPGPRFLTLGPGEALPPGQENNTVFVRSRVSLDGRKPDTTGAAAVTEVPESLPEPEEVKVEVQSAEQAIEEFSTARGFRSEVTEQALNYWRKAS